MKKIFYPLLLFFIASCSTDSTNSFNDTVLENTDSELTPEETEENPETEPQDQNTAPVLNLETYLINEHASPATSIGFIQANDAEGDEITYSISSEVDIEINETTGELSVGPDLQLDFETMPSIEFMVSVFDGATITEENFELIVEDIDETALLTPEETDLISYFQHLVYWKGHANTPVERNQKWATTMKIYLQGTISNEFAATVEDVMTEYNEIFKDGFNIVTEENESESNATVFYGSEAELENVWPDMYEIVKDGGYSGYAITPSNAHQLSNSRIWISNPAAVLFKHELGHALGFGHSNKCQNENSFLCSQISTDNDFLPEELSIIRYAYHDRLQEGLTETEAEAVLADIIVNEQ
ncbi:zinc metalloprotease [Euzebyella saccharophila]|uniref:Cadherin domain-containing protein n=1 Tax=Euzebyella saccharophila TaxID=679664 RepID=A0ABV8JM48_9FLAO|nr:hypothetical protein [Euzebyella saccharophila]